MNLNLQRPIVFFDLETTGVQVGKDHIVQICMHKVNPDQTEETRTYLVRPADPDGNTLPIPPESTAVHGITDEMVRHERSFRQLADTIAAFIADADLAGYNSNRFDVPLLVEEFLRAGINFSLRGRRLVDVQNIFHKMEQRTLAAAYRFYCGKELENAHSADADTMATYEVLKAQLDRYEGADYQERDGRVSQPVVNDIDALARFSRAQAWADLVGHIALNDQAEPVFNFGKYKGQRVADVFDREPSYFDWMMRADFPLSTKQCIQDIYEEMRHAKALRLRDKYSH